MSKKDKDKTSEDELIRRHMRWMHGADIFFGIMKFLIVSACIWSIAYTGIYLPIKETAGQETTITVLQKWVLDANIQVYIGWAVAGAAGLYAKSQRKKRMTERAERDNRIIELEKMIDARRESSGMDTEGETEVRKK